ncbi:MAG: ABC transporter ATP-binding protein [Treponema sp.]|nr:ABC transporter ATP-binding protein [Treponema sp.]
MLEVNNLTVGIKKEELLKAVNNISFKIEEGEIIGLAGESGSGKSMTAHAITNMLPSSFQILGGEIIYNGQSLTDMDEKELCRIRGKEIGMIFQEVRQSLNPLMRIGNQITEMLNNGKWTGRQKYKEQVLEMLVTLGFDEPKKVFDAFPHQLSGGMCQRVMTAIAAVCRPKLLLADEPSSALDEESQGRILSLLLEMNRKYKTSILIISHDLSIIRQFCSRFLVMYAGKIIEEGPAQMLFSPLHPYTKALVAAIPGKEKKGLKLENIPGKAPSIEDNFSGCPFAPRCGKSKPICKETFPPAVNTDNRRVYCYGE